MTCMAWFSLMCLGLLALPICKCFPFTKFEKGLGIIFSQYILHTSPFFWDCSGMSVWPLVVVPQVLGLCHSLPPPPLYFCLRFRPDVNFALCQGPQPPSIISIQLLSLSNEMFILLYASTLKFPVCCFLPIASVSIQRLHLLSCSRVFTFTMWGMVSKAAS